MISRNKLVACCTALLLLVLAGPLPASGDHEGGHDDAGHGGEGHGDEGHHDGGGHSFGFGEPAPASQADRTVRITAKDTMKFSPDSVTVEAGETVTFVVENVGRLQHSFSLATPTAQREHEKEMQGMPMDQMASHMDDDPNGIVVQPGQTDRLTWHFTEGGPVQFACHIPGHYPAGMKGRIRIE